MVSEGKLKAGGTYREWLLSYCKGLRSNAAGWLNDDDMPDPLREARIRETNMKADKLELEICEKAGELVSLEEFIELQVERELAAKTELNTLPAKISAHYEAEHGVTLTDKDKRFLNESTRAVTRHMEGVGSEESYGGES